MPPSHIPIIQPAKDIPRDAQGRPITPKASPRRRNKSPEADFQKQVTAYLRLALPPQAGIFWSATLNGQRIPTEAGRRRAKEQGLNPGVFDFVFIVLEVDHVRFRPLKPGDTYWLELKAKDGRLTKEQKVLMDTLWDRDRGATAKTLDQVAAALDAWGFPIRARP